jgi:hypothetical protein
MIRLAVRSPDLVPHIQPQIMQLRMHCVTKLAFDDHNTLGYCTAHASPNESNADHRSFTELRESCCKVSQQAAQCTIAGRQQP